MNRSDRREGGHLLQEEGALPVDADEANHSEVPHGDAHGDVVHRLVLRLQDLPGR